MDRKGTKRFLSLARSGGYLKMPGDEQKSINRALLVGHYLFNYVSIDNCISRATMQRGINKIPKCFSCPGDCKELSKETE